MPGRLLLPYNNQVTGHDCLLTTEDYSAVCKIRHLKELDFYQKMDISLKPFVPEFRGTVEVSVVDDYGSFRFEADWNEAKLEEDIISNYGSPNGRRATEEYVIANRILYRQPDPIQLASEPGFQTNDYTNDIKFPEEKIVTNTGRNPWVDRVHRIGRHVNYAGTKIPYIVLENICGKFQRPCIIDLKMGTQIHDEKCTKEKLLKHLEKNKMTTTCTMGLRLCGLQIYDCGVYHCRDKYYGRGLSNEGLMANIKVFFSSAGVYKKQILQQLARKIVNIRQTVLRLDGYRFNGTSLLLLYEGFDNIQEVDSEKSDARIVDFAHCHMGDTGADEGFIFGLDNLIQIVNKLLSEE